MRFGLICAVNTAPLKNANTAMRDLARVTTPVGEINVLRLFLQEESMLVSWWTTRFPF